MSNNTPDSKKGELSEVEGELNGVGEGLVTSFPVPTPDASIIEQKSSFKLIKNTKGYNWEIRCVDMDLDNAFSIVSKIDAQAREKWGNGDGK